jgi:transposase
MNDSISIPLDIEGVKVNRVDVTANGEVHIHVTSTVEGACCHRCGRETREFYDSSREIKLRHLPILGKPTTLFLKPRRYVCRQCRGNPTTTQPLPWYEARCSTTRVYEEQILKSLVNSTVYDVSEKEALGYDTVEDILARHKGCGVNWEAFNALPTLGIDELSIKKGHRDFVTVVSVRAGEGQNQVLGILEGRDKATVKAFFLSIPKPLRRTVHTVCSDLYEG